VSYKILSHGRRVLKFTLIFGTLTLIPYYLVRAQEPAGPVTAPATPGPVTTPGPIAAPPVSVPVTAPEASTPAPAAPNNPANPNEKSAAEKFMNIDETASAVKKELNPKEPVPITVDPNKPPEPPKPADPSKQGSVNDDEDEGGKIERKQVGILSTLKFLGSQNKPDLPKLKSDKFNKGLSFDNLDNGIQLLPVEFEYDLSEDNGEKLKMGPMVIDSNALYINILPLKSFDPKLAVLGRDSDELVFMVKWPEGLFQTGNLELISKTGSVEWKTEITEQTISDWNQTTGNWEKKITSNPNIKNKGVLFKSQFGIYELNSENSPFWKLNSTVRFCLTSTKEGARVRFCSQFYNVAAKAARSVTLTKVKSDVTPRIIIHSEEAPLKGSIKENPDKALQVFAEMSTGVSYEFLSLPNNIMMTDMIAESAKGNITITGFGPKPLGPVVELTAKENSWLVKKLGFEQTIGDFRKFWKISLSRNNLSVYLPGEVGGIFKQSFNVESIPTEAKRIYVGTDTPLGTYSDEVSVDGVKQPSMSLASDQWSVEVDPKDPSSFEWKMQASKKGAYNRSYLWLDTGKTRYRTYYEIYKGYPQEFSSRLTGISSSSGFLIMAELAYNHWFDTFLGMSNYYFGRQRWGGSFKMFQALTKLHVSGNTANQTVTLASFTADLKYRFAPGLWGRDETTGGILSYQNLTYSTISAPMMGVGWFWARSIPQSVGRIFNKISFLRNEKWVDMELIYYLSSTNPAIQLDPGNLALNFHGKVMWTPTIFGEMGFGMKQFAVTDLVQETQASLTSFYGTMGIGINF
jgi:hypothetical protein